MFSALFDALPEAFQLTLLSLFGQRRHTVPIQHVAAPVVVHPCCYLNESAGLLRHGNFFESSLMCYPRCLVNESFLYVAVDDHSGDHLFCPSMTTDMSHAHWWWAMIAELMPFFVVAACLIFLWRWCKTEVPTSLSTRCEIADRLCLCSVDCPTLPILPDHDLQAECDTIDPEECEMEELLPPSLALLEAVCSVPSAPVTRAPSCTPRATTASSSLQCSTMSRRTPGSTHPSSSSKPTTPATSSTKKSVGGSLRASRASTASSRLPPAAPFVLPSDLIDTDSFFLCSDSYHRIDPSSLITPRPTPERSLSMPPSG